VRVDRGGCGPDLRLVGDVCGDLWATTVAASLTTQASSRYCARLVLLWRRGVRRRWRA
jgi:hypothetical protein